MDCRDFSENLQAYIDGELSEVERIVLEEHLQGCSSCSEELRDLRRVNSLLSRAFSGKPSTSGIMARIIAKVTGAAPAEKKPEPEPVEGDPSTSLVDQTLAGYKIAEKIGSGGMGTVYRAVQLSMNRDVALKVLYHRYSQDETFVKRFIREARSAGGLNHPNMVRVYDVGHERGFYYMSQEFVDGRSALQMLAGESRMEPERALDIIIQTARALEHAQKRSIIHRDVKPENIIVDKNGHVKLADLGLAKKIGMSQDAAMTVEGQVMGTPQYMSPEQVIDASSVDHRTDIYSLGATFFFMVTGDRPFEGKTAMEAMVAVIHDEIKFTREHLAYVPKQIVKVIEKMTAKDRDERHQTATELLKELEFIRSRLLTYQAPAAPPRPRAVRAATARREREPSSALEKKVSSYMWLAAVAAGLLLVVGLWIAFGSSTPEKVPDDVALPTPTPAPPAPTPAPSPPETPEPAVVKAPEVEGQAKKEWEAVLKFKTEHPEDYAEILERLAAIFQGYPSSRYAQSAETLHSQTVQELEGKLAEYKKKSDGLRKVRNYNEAIALWEDFEQRYAGTNVGETGASYRRQMVAEQNSKFRRDMKVADSRLKDGDNDGAIYQLEKILEYGTDEMKKQAVAKTKSIEGQLAAKAQEEKNQKQAVLLDEFYRRTVEHIMDGQHVRAVEAIDMAANDPHFAEINDYINLERTDVLHLMGLNKALNGAFRKMASSTTDAYVKLRDRDKAIVGKVKEISPDVFVLTPRDKKHGNLITLKVSRLSTAEVIRLTKEEIKDTADARMKYYLLYVYEGDFAKAIEYLDKASGCKRVVVQEKKASAPPPLKKKPVEEELSEASKKLKELMKKYGKDLEEAGKKIEKEIGKLAEKKPEAKPGGQPTGEVVEKIVDPGDPRYAICYAKFERVKPVITEVLKERDAKKLYDSGKLAYRKRDYENAQEAFERLLGEEFERAKYLDKAKREELARLLKTVETKLAGHLLAGRELEKDEVASLFAAAKVEKLRGGKYRVTYDFTKPEQLKDFLIGKDLINDKRMEELFSWRDKKVSNYEEARAWAVVKYQRFSMLNGKGDHTFMWKGMLEGDVTLEFSAIPLRRENVVGVLHANENGAYVLGTSYKGGDADWHRNTFGLTRSVVFRRYWDDDPRIRLLNGGWQVIGDAGKKIVTANTPYTIKCKRTGNKLVLYVNGQRYVEGSDNTWSKGRAGVWARESNVLFTNIRITGKLDKKWVDEELKRLGRKKEEEKKKRDEKVAKKEDPYKGASESTKRMLDAAKKLDGITNDDLMRLRKVAEQAENMPGGWGRRIGDRLSGEIGRLKDAEELRRRLDEIERMLDPGNNPWGPGRGPGRPGGGRPGGGGRGR